MGSGSIVIRKVWRSELRGLVVFAVLCVVSLAISIKVPQTVVEGKLFEVFGVRVDLALPVLCLAPFAWLSMLIFRIYNVRYVADARGIEAYEGILSFSQRIIRVRYEDVRSIESDQTLIERLLDIGTVEIGTAATAGVELIMDGIAAPKSVQDFIQNERDRRQNLEPAPQIRETAS